MGVEVNNLLSEEIFFIAFSLLTNYKNKEFNKAKKR
jgi:hypothetical protein